MPAELLTDSGTANQKHTGSPHIYTYILKGDGVEKWNPRFSYYGFRYLQVTGAEPKGSAYKEYPALQK
ncbi:family 78 glycoside hydrolase catalytic domain [Niabella defluvii]|nr:family 78 glycoside hydrolase catalytic domain [Niabella sp. I65]